MERIFDLCGILFITLEIGKVTNFSISSALRPGHCVIIRARVFVTSGNGGGHIAHLGGALAGWWFAWSLNKGHDITKWINSSIDWLFRIFDAKKTVKKPKMKVNKGGRAQDYDYNAQKKRQSEEVDRILDKLKKSGYGSLTTEEKKRLLKKKKK